MSNQMHPSPQQQQQQQQEGTSNPKRKKLYDESVPTVRRLKVHPALVAKYAHELEFLKLGMEYETIGSEIFDMIDNLPVFAGIDDTENEQTEGNAPNGSCEVEVLETIHNQDTSGLCSAAESTRVPYPDVDIPPYIARRINYLLNCFNVVFKNGLVSQMTVQIDNTVEVRQESAISKNISHFLKMPQRDHQFLNTIRSLTPYDEIKNIPGHVEECHFVNQFRYVVTAGIYWAGLKACSNDTLTLADILPFELSADIDEPFTSDHRSIKIGETILHTLKKSRSCSSLIEKATHLEVLAWIREQMVNYWAHNGTDDTQHNENVRVHIRSSRNYVLVTMLAMFSSTDFMLVDVLQYKLGFKVDYMHDIWHRLYNTGQSFNKRLNTEQQDRFNSKDVALYADYIINGNYFSRLIAAYPDVSEFIDHYFNFFRSLDDHADD